MAEEMIPNEVRNKKQKFVLLFIARILFILLIVVNFLS